MHRLKGGVQQIMPTVMLRHMLSGQRGVVSKVIANGELGRRIRDMGLVPGTPIMVQGRAPLKDPVAVRVRNFTLTLRNNEADFIHVEVEDH
jgi:ferrous iron transport protein A